MRWLVEVIALGKEDRESLHVDADTWQKALQVARTQRGEGGPMSGFAIELLDDGCRAIDPSSRLKYEVRRAVTSVPPAAPASGGPPRPSAHQPASRKPAPSASETPPAARADVASTTVPSQVLFKREQDATEALPLTYREYVFVVHPGTTEAAAETLLQTQLDLVKTSLERVPAGKLVNLAVFDVSFQGRPPVPPLATMSWKDWRGPPVLAFPRRLAPPPVHAPGAVAPVPIVAVAPPAAAAPLAPAPMATASLAPAPVVAQPVLAVPPPPADVIAAAVGVPVPALPAALPVPAAASAASVPGAVAAPPNPLIPQTPPPSFAPALAISPAPVVAPAPAPAIGFAPPAASTPAPPAPAPFVPAAPLAPAPAENSAGAPVVPPAPANAGLPLRQGPFAARTPPPTPGVRVRGEELIADLFEAMHDLHFARDAIEGGDFCLALAMEKLPCQAGIVHLYDINRREFVVANARGPGAEALLLMRSAESDPLLSAAMRKRRGLVLADAALVEFGALERHTILGGARSLIVAPAMDAGRFLGAIELANPLDGQPFTESDGNAVSYIAQQLAEFVATRGVVTDPERIGARRAPEV